MRYVAFLRGINVGGNTIIKMADLKAAIEDAGYGSVRTYIASGNVILESDTPGHEIERDLERIIAKRFSVTVMVMVRSGEEVRNTVRNMPKAWHANPHLRCYVAFVKDPVTPDMLAGVVVPRAGVDTVTVGKRCVYLATEKSGITKSGISKMIGTVPYKHATMRNMTTIQKIIPLL